MTMAETLRAALTPEQRRWCDDAERAGLLTVDGFDLEVTDAGWQVILEWGAHGTDLEGAVLTREFVLASGMCGGSAVQLLMDATGVIAGMLAAGGA